MRLTASGLKRQKDMSQKLRMYSKSWNPGDSMRVVFPVEKIDGQWEILAGGLWGHKVNDFDGVGLKTALIPSSTEFDDNGTPVGIPDITYQFSMIAPVFVKGMKADDEAAIMRKPFPSEASKQEALRKIEHKYDAKNNMKAIKPAVGRATLHIFTECVAYKYQNDMPVLDSAAIYSFPLASQRIDQLYTILRDPKFAPNEGDKYWEVEWKYPVNADRGQSAKAANPNGLTAEYRTAVKFADSWKIILEKCAGLATDGDTIVRRTTKFVDQARIKSALTQYAIMNSQYLESAPDDDKEVLVKNALVVKELAVLESLADAELIAKIKDEIQSIPATAPVPEAVPDMTVPTLGDPVVPAPAPVPELVPGAPTVADLTSAAPTMQHSNPMQNLLNNPNLSDMSELEMEEVNLEIM